MMLPLSELGSRIAEPLAVLADAPKAYDLDVQDKTVFGLGALMAFLGVAAGAFGAHALRDQLGPDRMAIYQTGVQYHLLHAVAMVAIASQDRVKSSTAGILFFVGILIFSGSLYTLAITGTTWWGAVTPFGGIAFLVGWAMLAWNALSSKQ
jgi:uncharacterized membrane protein YgdD (TMEM256/DUF423 family)